MGLRWIIGAVSMKIKQAVPCDFSRHSAGAQTKIWITTHASSYATGEQECGVKDREALLLILVKRFRTIDCKKLSVAFACAKLFFLLHGVKREIWLEFVLQCTSVGFFHLFDCANGVPYHNSSSRLSLTTHKI